MNISEELLLLWTNFVAWNRPARNSYVCSINFPTAFKTTPTSWRHFTKWCFLVFFVNAWIALTQEMKLIILTKSKERSKGRCIIATSASCRVATDPGKWKVMILDFKNLRPRKTGVSKEKLWKVLEFENSRFFARSWKAVGEMEKNNAAGDPGRGSCRNYRSAKIAYFIVLGFSIVALLYQCGW